MTECVGGTGGVLEADLGDRYETACDPRLTDNERAFWAAEFQDLEAMPETQEALGDGPSMLTDADIARIEREIEDEMY